RDGSDRDLTELHAEVEREQRQHNAASARADTGLTQSRCEAKAMYQPKAKRHYSSCSRNVAAQKILGADENDGSSDQWLDNSAWNLHQRQGGHRQCDRVRDRK